MLREMLATCALLIISSPLMAQRLPSNVIPEAYTLWFAPDLDADTFRGRETIEVVLKDRTQRIEINAAEIAFDDVQVDSGGRVQRAQVTVHPDTETASLLLPAMIGPGEAAITIAYRGILNDKLRGFYRSSANGRKYAVTQLEATDARRAFPCFDEPSYKATFDVSVTIDVGDTAISNGAQISDTPGPEPSKHTIRFARTPRMSTYLVAMLVGDFVCRAGAADGIPVRVCSTPDKRELTAFALEAAERELSFFATFTGLTYAFRKLDIVGIPDFAAGAMENAGAITVREASLLVDPVTASIATRKEVARILSHEIAHMWFGDLVTMTWWDDIWLNEGFATWMENKPLASWHPEWNVDVDETAASLRALEVDALRSTRPIRTSVATPDEINEVFDAIAYEKTAAVLRMVEAYVGPESFRKAVGSYLRTHAFGNTTGEDFWNEVTRTTGRPVDRMLRSFIEQAGAPLLSALADCGEPRSIVVTQERFTGEVAAGTSPDQTWIVPVCLGTSSGRPECSVLERTQQPISAPACGPVLLNAAARGYYVSMYPPEWLGGLTGNVATWTPSERLQFMADEWWMARSGRHGVAGVLSLAGRLADDASGAIVEGLQQRLAFVDAYFVGEAQRARYQQWIRTTFAPTFSDLGLPGSNGDSDEVKRRRASLLQIVGAIGNDQDVQRRARALVETYFAEPASIPPTLVQGALRVAASGGDTPLYELYVSQLQRLQSKPEEYYRVLDALPWFPDPALTRRTLELALSPSIRSQDTGTVISVAMGRSGSREAAWEFTKAHWSELVAKLDTFQGIPAIVSATGSFCSEASAADIRRFFDEHPTPTSARAIRRSLERVQACSAIAEQQAGPMTAFLAAQSGAADAR